MPKAIIITSASQFIQEMGRIQNGIEKWASQFTVELATMIQKQTQDNIRKTFGRGAGGAKSDLTSRSYGSNARSSGRSGALMNSVLVAQNSSATEATVTVGGTGVPYAAIQETGGVIRPKKAKYLTIPFQAEYRGSRARERNLVFAFDPKWGPVLRVKGPANIRSEAMIAFLLRRKVTLKPRPYFQPAIDAVTKDPRIRAQMMLFFGSSKLDVEIK